MTKFEALKLIERIVSDDFSQDLEMDLYNKKLNEKEKFCAKKLGLIYRISHSLTATKCSHPNWIKEAEELYKNLKGNI